MLIWENDVKIDDLTFLWWFVISWKNPLWFVIDYDYYIYWFDNVYDDLFILCFIVLIVMYDYIILMMLLDDNALNELICMNMLMLMYDCWINVLKCVCWLCNDFLIVCLL